MAILPAAVRILAVTCTFRPVSVTPPEPPEALIGPEMLIIPEVVLVTAENAPFTVMLFPDVMLIFPPEIRLRFVPSVALVRSIRAVFTIAEELLLIVSVHAVIRLISVCERPRQDVLSDPPRFNPLPSV